MQLTREKKIISFYLRSRRSLLCIILKLSIFFLNSFIHFKMWFCNENTTLLRRSSIITWGTGIQPLHIFPIYFIKNYSFSKYCFEVNSYPISIIIFPTKTERCEVRNIIFEITFWSTFFFKSPRFKHTSIICLQKYYQSIVFEKKLMQLCVYLVYTQNVYHRKLFWNYRVKLH